MRLKNAKRIISLIGICSSLFASGCMLPREAREQGIGSYYRAKAFKANHPCSLEEISGYLKENIEYERDAGEDYWQGGLHPR